MNTCFMIENLTFKTGSVVMYSYCSPFFKGQIKLDSEHPSECGRGKGTAIP